MNDKSIFTNLSVTEIQNLIVKAMQNYFDTSLISKNTKIDIELMSRSEAASYLKISFPTLLKLTKQGKLTASRIGRKKLYNKSELEKAIISLKIKYK